MRVLTVDEFPMVYGGDTRTSAGTSPGSSNPLVTVVGSNTYKIGGSVTSSSASISVSGSAMDVGSWFSSLSTGLNQIANQTASAIVNVWGSITNFINSVMDWISSQFQGPSLL
jgi:phage-related protein